MYQQQSSSAVDLQGTSANSAVESVNSNFYRNNHRQTPLSISSAAASNSRQQDGTTNLDDEVSCCVFKR